MGDTTTKEATYQWDTFTRKKKINASMEAIYKAWTSQKDIESWFLKTAKFTDASGDVRTPEDRIHAGDTWTWTWYGWDGEDSGRILEVNGRDLVKFTFAEDCEVTVRIAPDGDGHMVELVQDEIPTTEDAKVQKHLGCSVGWVTYLMNLKSVLEGGLDLREKE